VILPHAVLLPQQPVENLAGTRTRHLFVFDEDDIFGDFIAGDFALTEVGNLFPPLPSDPHEAQQLPSLVHPILVRHSNDSHISDLRIASYAIFHFGREDVFTTGYDHIGFSINKVDVTVFIPHTHVSRAKIISLHCLSVFSGSFQYPSKTMGLLE
jgi:hypothetical protein